MAPRIPAGSWVLYDREREAQPDDVVVVGTDDGRTVLKRLIEIDGVWHLTAARNSVPPVPVGALGRILGVILTVTHRP